jgi:hypothetical protein
VKPTKSFLHLKQDSRKIKTSTHKTQILGFQGRNPISAKIQTENKAIAQVNNFEVS